MQQITISSSKLDGTISAPPSKSLFQRACAAAVLKQGATVIKNGGYSDDDKAAIEIIKKLGANVVFVGTTAIIKFENNSSHITDTLYLDCKESGLSSRMFMPIAAVIYYASIIDGAESLKKRPFGTMIQTLKDLGIEVSTDNGSLPIKLIGNLLPRDITIDGSVSSQFLTGLLLAFSSFSLSEPITITVLNLVSKPYIDLTLQVIEDFGLNLPQSNNYSTFVFPVKTLTPGHQFKYEIEGDWSATTTMMVAGALAGNIVIEDINTFSKQGDKAVLQALMSAGVRLSIEENKITVQQSPLKAFHYNAVDTPDVFPVLAALATQCEGTTAIEGVTRLVHKESNRANAILEVLEKLGVQAKIQDDILLIEGKQSIKGNVRFDAYGDHRIAMMICLLGLIAEEPIVLENAQVINKSYPLFYEELIKIGANIKMS